MCVLKLGPVGALPVERGVTTGLERTVLSGGVPTKRVLALRDATRRLKISVAPAERTFRVLTESKLLRLRQGGHTMILKIGRGAVHRRFRIQTTLRDRTYILYYRGGVSLREVSRVLGISERRVRGNSFRDCSDLGRALRVRL